MPRHVPLVLVLVAAALAGCTAELEPRFPKATEVEHVVVDTGHRTEQGPGNETSTWSSSIPLEPDNATHQRIVEHALPLLEHVDEATLEQARIESDSETPGNARAHVDLLFADETPLRWSSREPIEPAFVTSMRVVIDPADGSDPIVAVETENGWSWWRTDADIEPIREAALPIIAAAEAREDAGVSVKRPTEAATCDHAGFDQDEVGLARVQVENLANWTLAAWNASHVRGPEAYTLDAANRTVHVDDAPERPVHLALQLDVEGQPAHLVLGDCRSAQMVWDEHPPTHMLTIGWPGMLRIEHLEEGCPKNATIPDRNITREADLITTGIEPGQKATIRFLEGGGEACPGATFAYTYEVGWRMAAQAG